MIVGTWKRTLFGEICLCFLPRSATSLEKSLSFSHKRTDERGTEKARETTGKDPAAMFFSVGSRFNGGGAGWEKEDEEGVAVSITVRSTRLT